MLEMAGLCRSSRLEEEHVMGHGSVPISAGDVAARSMPLTMNMELVRMLQESGTTASAFAISTIVKYNIIINILMNRVGLD